MARKPLQKRPDQASPADAPPLATAQRAGPRHHLLDALATSLDASPPVQRLANGLPSPLQAGIESLSGMSMSHVRVHHNSPKPAQLQAHAYAQGAQIHLAPGQEHHLPHEAWHVVQQAQGRVRANMDVSGTPINDSPALEHEADTMGRRALASPPAQRQAKQQTAQLGQLGHASKSGHNVAQLAGDYDGLLPAHETHGDHHIFQGQRNSEFTYHHIIPENKLHDAYAKLRVIMKYTDPQHALHAGVESLKANAREQWLKTRAVNTAHAFNKEFDDYGLNLSVAAITPLIEAHSTFKPLFDAVLTAAKNQLIPRLETQFNKQANKLKDLLVALLKSDAFFQSWGLGQGAGAITAEVIQVNQRIHGYDMYDPAEFTAILDEIPAKSPKGHSNKGELVRRLVEHARRPAVQSFFMRNYTALHGSKGNLASLVRDNGLPKEGQDELEDAITWNPGNIHRGPKSSLRLSPSAKGDFDRLLDDGGDEFEVAAVNIVSTGHYQSLEALSADIETLDKLDVTQPSGEAIELASQIVHKMVALQQFGVTQFHAGNWEELPPLKQGGKPFVRLKQNDQAIRGAAQGSPLITRLGRAKNIQGI